MISKLKHHLARLSSPISKLKLPKSSSVARVRPYSNPYTRVSAAVFVIVFASIGFHLLIASHAATPGSLGSSGNGNSNTVNGVLANTTIAPATNLSLVDSSPTQAYLTWTASTDANVTSYAIYQGSTQVGTSDALTTGYLATNLTPSTTYNYSVYAVVSGTNSLASNVANVLTPSTTTPITSCGTTISTPGNYVLNGDLTDSAPSNIISSCITIANTNHVSLDCQNNNINMVNGSLAYGIQLSSVSNFLVTNCGFTGGTPNDSFQAMNFPSDQDGTIENNTFGNSSSVASNDEFYPFLTYNSYVQFNYNIIYNGFYQAQNDNYDSINHNTITCGKITACADGIDYSGSNNVSAYNNINGEGGAQPGHNYVGAYGTDDGIDPGDYGVMSNDNVIEYNTLENFFDMGIETTGVNNYDTISYNNISNAANGGIGGWYWDSLLGNTVNDNTVTNAGYLFWFFESDGLPSGQSLAYFENNSFSGNVLIPGKYSVGAATNIDIYNDDGTQSIPQADLVTGNDTFTDNNFTPSRAVTIVPVKMVVDGGGNICGSSNALKISCPHVTPPPPVKPTAPTNLTATIGSPSGVFLSWTASTDPGGPGVAGYLVYRNDTALNTKKDLITGTSYTDLTAKQGPKYTYYVKAVDTEGNTSKNSNQVTYKGNKPTSMPQAPNVSAMANGASSVTISWSPSSDNDGPGIAAYKVLRDYKTIATLSARATSYTDTTTSAKTGYSYSVESIDAAGDVSNSSNTAKLTTLASPPSIPIKVTVKANSASSVTISWSPSSDPGGPGIAGYKVIRSEPGGDPDDRSVFSVGPNVTSYTDTTIEGNTDYTYSVEAIDTAGNNSVSLFASILTK